MLLTSDPPAAIGFDMNLRAVEMRGEMKQDAFVPYVKRSNHCDLNIARDR